MRSNPKGGWSERSALSWVHGRNAYVLRRHCVAPDVEPWTVGVVVEKSEEAEAWLYGEGRSLMEAVSILAAKLRKREGRTSDGSNQGTRVAAGEESRAREVGPG